jgi:hypothetical protein
MITALDVFNVNPDGQSLYTKGGQFTVKTTGEEYKGVYHKAGKKYFTGKPRNEQVLELLPLVYDAYSTYTYDKATAFKLPIRTYTKPVFYRPQPSESDYRTGFIFRFVVTHNININRPPVEVSPIVGTKFGGTGGIDPNLYTMHRVKWVISGEAIDFATKGGTIPSIENQNRETVEQIARKYPTIVYAFRNYTEFAQFGFS